jgi:hypothetical protein
MVLHLSERLARYYSILRQQVSPFVQDDAERPPWALPEDQQRRTN